MPQANRPNILWICTDSQRWDTLGCYGNPHVKTPNADRLAARGVLFEGAFVQNPLCMPSRGSFLTGRYPSRTGLRQNGQTCPPDLRPVTRDFKQAGYVCGLAGKFHLNNCDARLQLGSDWQQRDKREWFAGAERRIDDGYDVFHWDHAARTNDPASAYSQWFQQQGVEDPTQPREDCPLVLKGRPSRLHQSTWCADRAIDFITGYADQPHPWLFSVNLFDPHFDFDPPPEFLAPYLDRLDALPLPDFDPPELNQKPAVQRRVHQQQVKKNWMSDKPCERLMRAAYWAMCDHIDVQLGRLLDCLDQTGAAENTIVVFMSDHGEMLGDHGLYKKGPFLYDPAIRVPLIISGPDIAAGRRVGGLVELTDLVPTLREACDLGADPTVQGRSLWPVLRGETDRPVREEVYCEYWNANPEHPRQYLTMVRTDCHKLIRHHGGTGVDAGELYDLETDPTETHNRWHDPAYADVRTHLLMRLSDRMAHAACNPLPERVGVF